ncbi:MAG: hypothetical protein DMF61_04885 [Blastocatellia bacterium AA13]|nr:MAG: hypothetical protein DMF61_04885 [Blastocatellia bacterium AA13]
MLFAHKTLSFKSVSSQRSAISSQRSAVSDQQSAISSQRLYPEGVPSISPAVAVLGYPGITEPPAAQPQRGCGSASLPRRGSVYQPSGCRTRLPWDNGAPRRATPTGLRLSPTHSVHPIRCCACAAERESHLESSICDDALPGW